MVRPLPLGVVFDATGLPRPSAQAIRQREQNRRFLLRQVTGLDLDSLPAGLQQLLLRPRRFPSTRVRTPLAAVLNADERQRLVNALVARRLDERGVAAVLNLIGDLPLSREGLKAMVDEATAERERVERPGENFSILSVERLPTGGFVLELRTDDGRQSQLKCHAADLRSQTGFRAAAMKQTGFLPILKPAFRGDRFDYFVDDLLRRCR